jgi:hypothetical protein
MNGERTGACLRQVEHIRGPRKFFFCGNFDNRPNTRAEICIIREKPSNSLQQYLRA